MARKCCYKSQFNLAAFLTKVYFCPFSLFFWPNLAQKNFIDQIFKSMIMYHQKSGKSSCLHLWHINVTTSLFHLAAFSKKCLFLPLFPVLEPNLTQKYLLMQILFLNDARTNQVKKVYIWGKKMLLWISVQFSCISNKSLFLPIFPVFGPNLSPPKFYWPNF